MTGRFITLEGGEGSGKTTQLSLLERAFIESGLAVRRTREPGGSEGAEKLRHLLLDEGAYDWDAQTETLLFYAARLDHLHRMIRPTLAAGTHLLCDRFADSTFVYQGVAKGVDAAWLQQLHDLSLGGFAPDLTLVLEIPVIVGLNRAQERQDRETRFEQLGPEFHERVRQGFLERAAREPERCAVINANAGALEIHHLIVSTIGERLGLALQPAKETL